MIGVEVQSATRVDELVEIELTNGARLRARSGVLATGVDYRRLDATGVEDLVGRGVHYGSATGAATAYRDRDVVIVGGANSAAQAALDLADHASRVTMLDARRLALQRERPRISAAGSRTMTVSWF